ncbi:hypothetical protein FACHB389_20755 [Nostoc calcicola FACHB-389]|nr:hypothetical protein FACHB389_20755 [Nostoc calcicola FACHB-389]
MKPLFLNMENIKRRFTRTRSATLNQRLCLKPLFLNMGFPFPFPPYPFPFFIPLISSFFILRQHEEIKESLQDSFIFLRRRQKLFMQQEKFTHQIVNFCKFDVFRTRNLITR